MYHFALNRFRLHVSYYFCLIFDCETDNHFALDDSEGDDEAKSCFPCPFCYVDIEVPVLCNHLEEEHCFEFKNAVCSFLYHKILLYEFLLV